MRSCPKCLFVFILVLGLGASAQERIKSTEDENPLLIVDHKEFAEQFCLLKASDSKANYYVIDLDKLPDDFAKAYFMNLVYKQDDIISIDSDFDKNHLWFKAFKMHAKEDVLRRFNQLKQKTDHALTAFSEEKKSLWLKVNSKY